VPNYPYVEYRALYDYFLNSPDLGNVYDQGEWLTLQAQGAYGLSMPNPNGSGTIAGPHRDLKLLSEKLTAVIGAWQELPGIAVLEGNPITITNDWFNVATNDNNYYLKWMQDFTSSGAPLSKMWNQWNVFSWNSANFQNGSQNPTQGTTASHFFVNSPDPFANNIANDTRGYYARHVFPSD